MPTVPIEVETTEYTDDRKYAEDGQLVEQEITFAKLPTKTVLNVDDPQPDPEPDTGGGGGTGPTVPDPKDPVPEGPIG